MLFITVRLKVRVLPAPPRSPALTPSSPSPRNTLDFPRFAAGAMARSRSLRETKTVRKRIGALRLWTPEIRFPVRGEGPARDSVRMRQRPVCVKRFEMVRWCLVPSGTTYDTGNIAQRLAGVTTGNCLPPLVRARFACDRDYQNGLEWRGDLRDHSNSPYRSKFPPRPASGPPHVVTGASRQLRRPQCALSTSAITRQP